MPIYTRTGDKGKTSLLGGRRVLKSDERVDTYGTVDELNSLLGVVVSTIETKHQQLAKELEGIQNDLFDIGSYLADPQAKPLRLAERIKEFETRIDHMTKKMPELHNFILPGGGRVGASLHQARTVCRRAERRLVGLMQETDIDDEIVKYLNRLSDLLFTMARFVNHKEKKKETIWSKQE
ncbi:MAG TPA: cob(I)yrinic acid a,c-diamide adenosyltransferase [Patescibacteria group bacterium]|nr:cob(I)yrinic acid a,c-diamide adenosyltransferase [Patescibacteria group bacterium]